VSWVLASFGLLALVLAIGFAWYERSHPSARTLALVATLAALAVVGRIAFAPLPNVKPTTDIVLLAGYVLGGAPGFMVGAVSALASNLFFGQGPWTPWQMGAWGLCGLLGAALAMLGRRRLRRVPLALWCGTAGLAFGAIMDFSTWVTFTGQHTLAQYLAISGVSLSFNLAHAVGNVLFCLAFGPALVRALQRYRDRLEVHWVPLPAGGRPLAVALLALVLVGGGLAVAPTARADVRSSALRYLGAAQNADGGFGGTRGEASSPLYSAWAAMGLAAVGARCDAGLVQGLREAARRVRATGDVERTLLGLRACRASDAGLGRRLASTQDRDGSFGGLVNATAFAVFSLRATGRSTGDRRVRRAGSWIAGQQNRDGGFNFGGRGGPSGVDDTAAALQGLRSAGRSRTDVRVRRAASFLVRQQNPDGGFPLAPGSGSNSQSTAWAVQGLAAAGRDVAAVRRRGSRSPLAYLSTLSAPDGSIRYSRTSAQTPVWTTAQALTALARAPFPILGRAVKARRVAAGASLVVARDAVRMAIETF
jgi:energy-coupling factor transport system substrate-specific component